MTKEDRTLTKEEAVLKTLADWLLQMEQAAREQKVKHQELLLRLTGEHAAFNAVILKFKELVQDVERGAASEREDNPSTADSNNESALLQEREGAQEDSADGGSALNPS